MSEKDVKEAVGGTLKIFPAADQHALIVCAELMDIEMRKLKAANQKLLSALEKALPMCEAYASEYQRYTRNHERHPIHEETLKTVKDAITNAKQVMGDSDE